MAQLKCPDLFDGASVVMTQQLGDFLAERIIFQHEAADKAAAAVVDEKKYPVIRPRGIHAGTRRDRRNMDFFQYADLAFGLLLRHAANHSPNRGPCVNTAVVKKGMVAQVHIGPPELIL